MTQSSKKNKQPVIDIFSPLGTIEDLLLDVNLYLGSHYQSSDLDTFDGVVRIYNELCAKIDAESEGADVQSKIDLSISFIDHAVERFLAEEYASHIQQGGIHKDFKAQFIEDETYESFVVKDLLKKVMIVFDENYLLVILPFDTSKLAKGSPS